MEAIPAPNLFVSLIPWLFMWITTGVFSLFIAKRKGKSPVASFFLCLIPLVNVLWLIYLASLCDIEIKNTIEKLKEELRNK